MGEGEDLVEGFCGGGGGVCVGGGVGVEIGV